MTLNTEKPPESAANQSHPALPCRGCQSDCRWRNTCEGRPWRTLKAGNGGDKV